MGRRKPVVWTFGAIAIGAAMAACGSPQPVAPSAPPVLTAQPAVPDFAGTWTGQYERTSCARSRTDYFLGYCRGLPGQPYRAEIFFEFAQAGNRVTGVVSKSDPFDPAPIVSGVIDESGELVMTEHVVYDHEAMDGYTNTADTTWRLRRLADGGLAGTFQYRLEGSGRQPGWMESTGTILSAARVR